MFPTRPIHYKLRVTTYSGVVSQYQSRGAVEADFQVYQERHIFLLEYDFSFKLFFPEGGGWITPTTGHRGAPLGAELLVFGGKVVTT